MRRATTREEKELFEKRFIEAMKKRNKLVSDGRKQLREAKALARKLREAV